MSIFSLELSKEVGPTKIKAYLLCVDGVNVIHEAEKELKNEGGYYIELGKLYSIVEQACDLKTLPVKKFRKFHTDNRLGKVYEAKTKNLRMYMVHVEKTGRAILILGKKSDQKRDAVRLKSLIELIADQGELPINQT